MTCTARLCLLVQPCALLRLLQVALVKVVGLDLGTTLIFTGLYNIASGALFGIPMPVQPMKAIAAVAVAQGGISLPEVLAAGVFVSAVTLLLGVTRLITVFNRWRGLPACCCRRSRKLAFRCRILLSRQHAHMQQLERGCAAAGWCRTRWCEGSSWRWGCPWRRRGSGTSG